MLLSLLLFLISAIVIYLSCEYFVNSIEWLGQRLNLGRTAVGSVLAAFGTALPECAVTFTAVVIGNTPESKDLGVGAAMGGPLVLATLAYAIVGGAHFFHRRKQGHHHFIIQANSQALAKDQLSFLAIFIVKVGLGLIAFSFKPWLGILFLVAYAVYVWREIQNSRDEDHDQEEQLEPLKLQPHSNQPSQWMIILQVIISLICIAGATHLFIAQLENLSILLAIPPHLVALLLSPVATELPEIMNALIWVRQGKERLALANISGAMMIQATLPSALGIFFTPWLFDGVLLTSGIITALAIVYLLIVFQSQKVDSRLLIFSSGFYFIFIALLMGYFHI
ncbi:MULTISPECIES: sodium:calcium antiporter [unclassified Acinetobacter]|uniref:sodium:calcium antiporter n=1 Tax=unclassified Acinetobacter TaxID=196816 RepID=UPI002934B30F|nr:MULTISPECIES: sodium:calcium antiporter [unclassified Acinetobacter]WOE32874.1 sodium:calcium antiporter [Acinetobacter sp. SAAs470]WOE38351.1 sodium:calcium antiporter [Acinetobacter sp. SAAs474]